ncbi:multiprotein bridging factor aMBF1 [Patescibacteria group bacterium]|nr:multiprotein bridging factor aMBF1 [Patescibacteria group bacterium]
MECEMCGKKSEKLTKVRVDGAILSVCDSCSKFGVPVDKLRSSGYSNPVKLQPEAVKLPQREYRPPMPRKSKPIRKRDNIENLLVVPEFAKLIHDARSKLEMTQDDLAAKILERKNVLANIERGSLTPDIRIARKLEKVLGVTLIETE